MWPRAAKLVKRPVSLRGSQHVQGVWRLASLQYRISPSVAEQTLRSHTGRAGPFCRCLATARITRAAAASSPDAIPPAASGTAAQAPATAAEKPSEDAKKKDEDDDKPLSWGKFFLYIGSGISGLIFLWYFRKAKYNLHQTEVLMLERWRTFPLYPAPGRSENAKLDGKGLPPDLVVAFAEWFVHTDLLEAGGVVRNDVLELFEELGLDEKHKAAQDFLQRGEGQLDEHRRLTGAGLQESVTLLSLMALPEDGSPCMIGEEGPALLRQKLPQRGPSVVDGAMALQHLRAGQVPAGAAALHGAQPMAPVAPSAASMASGRPLATSPKAGSNAATHEEISLGGVSESELRQLEDARLARIEEGLIARLNRQGSLSPAEESRLQDIREQRTKL